MNDTSLKLIKCKRVNVFSTPIMQLKRMKLYYIQHKAGISVLFIYNYFLHVKEKNHPLCVNGEGFCCDSVTWKHYAHFLP